MQFAARTSVRGERLGGRRSARQEQLQLPPADVAPGAVLPADLAVEASLLEAEALVQGDAGLVGEGDAGAGHAEAALAQALEEVLVEGAADAATTLSVGDVGGDAGAPAVGLALVVGGRVGVANHLSLPLRHQPGVAGGDPLDPRGQLLRARRLFLERDSTALDMRRVDRRAGGAIAGGIGGTDEEVGHGHGNLECRGMNEQGKIVRRSIGIVFADGGLLALTSTLPESANGHGEEEVAAVLCDSDGA